MCLVPKVVGAVCSSSRPRIFRDFRRFPLFFIGFHEFYWISTIPIDFENFYTLWWSSRRLRRPPGGRVSTRWSNTCPNMSTVSQNDVRPAMEAGGMHAVVPIPHSSDMTYFPHDIKKSLLSFKNITIWRASGRHGQILWNHLKNKESIPTRADFFLGHIDTPKNAVKTQDTRSKTDSRFSRVSLNSFSKKS